MPTPPACFTARLLPTAGVSPRLQSTTLPLAIDGLRAPTWQSSSPAASAVTIEAAARPPVRVTPLYSAPLPSVTVPRNERSCVLAATVVSHGLGCATVLA